MSVHTHTYILKAFRGPAEGNHGEKDMLDYREWEFKKDARFRNARLRLGKAATTAPLRAGEPASRNMCSTCSAAFESNMSLPM